MKSKVAGFFENFILMAIFLVLIQTVLEEVAVLGGWSLRIRNILIISGFAFDLIFSLEFFIRLFGSPKMGQYFFQERGWLDFLASVPLLMFNSGLLLLGLLTDQTVETYVGGLTVLKLVKAIRIARILRLLRVLKVFRKIKYADSVMAQRHITKVVAMGITTFIMFSFAAETTLSLLDAPSFEEQQFQNYQASMEQMEKVIVDQGPEQLAPFAVYDKSIMAVRDNGVRIYSLFTDEEYLQDFTPAEMKKMTAPSGRDYFFDNRPVVREQSINNLVMFGLVLVLVVVFMVIYTPHFALTISDPVNVMSRGMKESDFNYEVSVPEHYQDDEVFVLAKRYNEEFLPMKERTNQEEGNSVLGMDDLKDLF